MFQYNVSFLKNDHDILMVNRDAKPMPGLWNGIINEIEQKDHPDESVKRKIFEETNYSVEQFYSKGTFTWKNEQGETQGINVYLFTLDQTLMKNKIAKTRDGILQWKSIDWILDEENYGVHPILKQGIPKLLEKKGILTFEYTDGNVVQIPQTSHR
ncbi:MAG TPA: NUDIX domain-containing protein [Candidatus Pseudogracilibacillus intestinigallinarum]|uniref:NUDIX domain-containing protein n=1 Tax=Candidatus Pseudogracilibacillus intestinigallinarum TaxID=2838742 RepID=A0A9D1PM49_9BACI|nr:NUDIX domain-containing protein [Candidatus Pseudogracilibacillus intestinigallinarum]